MENNEQNNLNQNISVEDSTNQNIAEQSNMNTSANNNFQASTSDKNDKAGAWWLLGFFIPLVGIILFFVWKKETPKKAKGCLIGALVSIGISILLSVLLFFIFMISAGSVLSVTDKVKENAQDAQEKLKEYEDKISSTKEMEIGTWNQAVFENEFLGLKFVLPEGYSRLSDEEILEKMNVGKEVLEDEGYKISDINTVYHLMATNNKTNENVILISEKAKYQTVNTYINTLKRQLSSIETIKYTLYDPKDETINGIKFKTLEADGVVNGANINQKYYIFKTDDYITTITITSNTGKDTIDQLINYFTKIKN